MLNVLKVLMNIITALIPVSSLRKKFRGFWSGLINGNVDLKYELAYKTHLVNRFVDVRKLKPITGDLRKHQLELLEILTAVAKVFDKNGIVYWLDYGTLLGAIRHKGFIPWDDDVDITVMDCDLKKLRKIMKQLPKNMHYRTFGFKTNSARIWLNKLTTRSFVDIFFAFNVKKLSHQDCLKIKDGYKKSLAFNFHPIIGYFELNRKILYPYLKETFDEKSHILHTSIGEYVTSKRVPIVFDYDDVFPLKKIDFEGRKFLTPNNYEKFLKTLYGDYKQMPGRLFGWIHNKKFMKNIPDFE